MTRDARRGVHAAFLREPRVRRAAVRPQLRAGRLRRRLELNASTGVERGLFGTRRPTNVEKSVSPQPHSAQEAAPRMRSTRAAAFGHAAFGQGYRL